MQASLYASYNELFGADEIVEQRHLDAGVGLRLDIAPQRQFGPTSTGTSSGRASRRISPTRPQPSTAARRAAESGVTWRPGGGLFEWRVGYEGAYNYFEDDIYTDLNNVQHTIHTRGRWRFLPRSALIYDAEYTLTRYSDENSPQPDGDNLQARLGFSGLITRQLAFLGLLGWNSSFYEGVGQVTPAQDYDGYVAQAELKYFMQQGGSSDSARVGVSSLAAGFIRDFSNSYLGAFYVRDRGYMKFEYFMGNRFVASLEGGFARYSYPRISEAQGSFEQSRIDARLFGEYRLSDIVGLNTTILVRPSDRRGRYHRHRRRSGDGRR